jgi:hypothetical protein
MKTCVFVGPRAGSLLFPDVQWVDVGGGIGVVDREGGVPIDLTAVSTGLQVGRRCKLCQCKSKQTFD